ncbi:hypothetical protein BYT27DRAFT_7265572 [Phlegmacium glaucopus]|nr:hypothetical protein BYT27DRAFT_7265572 [Phlegmacium glaucopus]
MARSRCTAQEKPKPDYLEDTQKAIKIGQRQKLAEVKGKGDEEEDDGGNVEEQEEEETEVSSREVEMGDGEAKMGGREEEEEVGGAKELEAEKGGKEEEGERGSCEGTKELGSSNPPSSRPPRPQQQPQRLSEIWCLWSVPGSAPELPEPELSLHDNVRQYAMRPGRGSLDKGHQA